MADLVALCIDARDPAAIAEFWAGILGGEPRTVADGVVLSPAEDIGFDLLFLPSDAEPVILNRMHFDLTSDSLDQQHHTVENALRLGARHLDVGQLPEEEHVVLADPEGNPFCVIEPGNGFLAGCGFVGAVSCDGSQSVGRFWSRALGWPLVWDQDEETAIQSPYGGPKITWGGPPVNPRVGRNRLHFDLGATEAEVDDLLALGATRLDLPSHAAGAVVLADPDGNELCVLPS